MHKTKTDQDLLSLKRRLCEKAQKSSSRSDDSSSHLSDISWTYYPSEPIGGFESETVKQRGQSSLTMKPKEAATSFLVRLRNQMEAAESPSRTKNKPLRVASFIGFSILGAGAWGWGAFATFLFAIAATATLSNIIER